MREFRRDPIRREWVMIDGERPLPFPVGGHSVQNQDMPDRHDTCPFCPGREALTGKELFRVRPLKTGETDWDVRVVPNRLPLLRVETQEVAGAGGVFDWMSGIGADEVVIESPRHNDTPHIMSASQLARVFPAWRERLSDLSRDQRLRYVRVFKRTRSDQDPVCSHPHSRILATPFIPSDVESRFANMRMFHDYRGRCVVCDVLRQEEGDGSRIIAMNERFVAMAPYASLRPFEVWIVPRQHQAGFHLAQPASDNELAQLLSVVLRKMAFLLGETGVHQTLYTAAMGENGPWVHWYLELFPLLESQDRFSGDGDMRINPVPPEETAEQLRETEG